MYFLPIIIILSTGFICDKLTLLLTCSEEYDEYTREAFPWRRHTRDMSHGDSFSRRTVSLGRNHKMFGSACDIYSSNCNDKDIRDITNKVIY